jgi:predicted ATPase/DNA-binding CsgD family transcriptional regulator
MTLRDEFANGVHFVDLAPIREPALVTRSIAQVLGIRDAGDQALFETLRDYVRPRQLALVLDNLEQVIAAGALVADLLASSASLKILATSREPLHLSWEHEWPVPPLGLPPGSTEDQSLIAQSPAVTLFVERARAAKPDFDLTENNAVLVKDICVRLEGLPLAIELAAARVKLLPLAAIHGRLHQRLLLLTGGPRDSPVRHQTLRAAVAWSYGLLDSEEQAVFRALSVFVGGFTLEAAKAVAEPQSVAHPNMLERLQSLVDKSLLQVANAATVDEQSPRLRMLETIREFGLEQLSICGEFELVQEQHARFFRALVGKEDGWLPHDALRVWLDQLESDHDNLRAVLHWSQTAAEGAEIGPRLACALYLFWYMRGYFSEGREWYEQFLATLLVSQPFYSLRANLLWAAAFLAWRQGDYQAAGSLSDQSVALCANLEPDRNTLMALAVHGLVASHQARYSIAHASLERGLEAAHTIDDAYILALLLAVSGVLAYLQGNLSLARLYSEESLASGGHTATRAMNLDNLGSVARRRGDYETARSLHEQSLRLSRELSDRAAVAQSLANLGHVARALRDIPTARERYTESLLIRREIGDRHGVAMTCGNLGMLAQGAGDVDLARTWLNESLALARTVGDKRILGAALHQLAALDAAQADQPAAVAGFTDSLRAFEQVQDRWGIARALVGCADLLRRVGRPHPAKQLRAMADGLLESLDVRSPVEQQAYSRNRVAVEKELGTRRTTGGNSSPQEREISQVVERAVALLSSKSTAQPDEYDTALSDLMPVTAREREVAVLVARGLTNREIAAELVIAERTADTHVSNLLGKLGAKTRSQIAAWVVEHDLRPDDSI